MKIKSQKDFFAGLMFLAVGVAFAWGAVTYSVGEGARMGPGYFPLMLGIVMSILGAVLALKATIVETEGGDKIGKWAWKPLIFIILANLAFGVLLGGLPSIGLPPMGLIIGIYALTLIASLAGENFRLVPTLLLATVLAIGSYVAFIWALKLQMAVWPTFITG
ncbi:tripartite tricarboxylate transporter TctB family protein [Xylophilus sp. ASV27]|uniref:tripartite tricarboxylate transporter TctB family protein n=1 Tax=Xylophilus sp. ASV27 TaxID=2795129 RepID=UPI0018EDEC27